LASSATSDDWRFALITLAGPVANVLAALILTCCLIITPLVLYHHTDLLFESLHWMKRWHTIRYKETVQSHHLIVLPWDIIRQSAVAASMGYRWWLPFLVMLKLGMAASNLLPVWPLNGWNLVRCGFLASQRFVLPHWLKPSVFQTDFSD
jgi:hypothetical protein